MEKIHRFLIQNHSKIIRRYCVVILFVISLNLTSCRINNDLTSIQIELLQPVAFVIPENVKTIAIFDRDRHKNASKSLYNFGKGNLPGDTTLCKFNLSSHCTEGLAGFLEQEAYFQQVNNYSDSIAQSQIADEPDLMYRSSGLFDMTNTDALIFLDFFQFENEVSIFFDGTYRTRAALSWTIIYKDDTPSTIYNQIDTLFLNKSQYQDIQHKTPNRKVIYQDAANYLGKSFGTKLIPSWKINDRYYYQSRNPEMAQAEKYLKNHDWLKAGEIWNKLSKNKNPEIAAKASYNLALACEMEGKYDLAMDWLSVSKSVSTKNYNQHNAYCQQYLKVLTLRKYEIEKLEKQIRN